MADAPALPFRMLRRGLRAASRASASVVERMLKSDADPGPFGGWRREQVATAPDTPITVRFGDAAVVAERGATLLEIAMANAVDLRSYCGGNCSCGTCRIEVVEGGRNLSRQQGMEEMVLGEDHVSHGDRLACQAQVLGDVRVRIPEFF